MPVFVHKPQNVCTHDVLCQQRLFIDIASKTNKLVNAITNSTSTVRFY